QAVVREPAGRLPRHRIGQCLAQARELRLRLAYPERVGGVGIQRQRIRPLPISPELGVRRAMELVPAARPAASVVPRAEAIGNLLLPPPAPVLERVPPLPAHRA